MATKKIRDIVAKTGEYTDYNGNRKGRYVNAGSLMYNDEEKSFFIILNRCFNPAGIPPSEKGNPDSVFLSCFDPNRKGGGNNSSHSTGGNSANEGGDYAAASGRTSGGYTSKANDPLDLDDEIPF